MAATTPILNTHRLGPSGPVQILAIHGLTGHGRRWATLAERYLPEFAIAAPDLIGHGRSPSAAPWTIEANVAALAALVEADAADPVTVVGHSFGAAVGLSLAEARPDLVAALVLLDPAVGLDGEWMREIAHSMLDAPDYTDLAEARSEKANGSWADVPDADLDAELDEHLVALPNGRVGWRIDVPAMMSYWSELARAASLPADDTPTTLIRATRTDPPYVADQLVATLSAQLGADFTLLEFDCNHMVAQAKPAETAEVIRRHVG